MPHLFDSLLLLAADAAPAAPATPPAGEPGGAGGNPIISNPMFLIAILFAIFWFVAIRPQTKDKKKREEELRAVAKGDKVITNAGIHGVVTAVGDSDLTLRIDDENDVRIRIEKSALWQIKRDPEEASEEKSESSSSDGAKSESKAKSEKGKA